MTNPLDKSLREMRAENEMDDTDVDQEIVEDRDLDEYGRRIEHAHRLSGEPPSLAAIEWAEATVELPAKSSAEIATFKDGVRQRIEQRLAERTGSNGIGGWIQRARKSAALTEAEAARQAGLPVPAYRELESDRMPVWRTRARPFAALCRRLALDMETMVRWASLRAERAGGAAYGRVDEEGDARSEVLDRVAEDLEQSARGEFEERRDEFIAAYAAPSEGDAPSGR